MIIDFNTQAPTTGDRIIPLVQTDSLADRLAQLADALAVPADVLQRDVKADAREVVSFYGPGGTKTYLLGLGKNPQAMDWLRAFRKLIFDQKARLAEQVRVDLPDADEATVEAVVLGIRAGTYDLRLFQTDKPEPPAFLTDAGRLTLVVAADRQEAVQAALNRAEVIAQTTRQMLDLMNAPANLKSPGRLGDWTLASGRDHGYAVTVLNRAELERQGLNALLSVAQGSDVPPVLIVAEYKPEGVDKAPTVGLVGKGVTFDTGGVSIKDSANMHLMKSDMGGAAAVLGTVEVAARLRLPVHLIGIVPATENSTDGRSTKPGDVITAYNGKTIEVIDTDAEGRVILADGLGYMLRHYQPDVLIDLATLTGSVIGTLGYHAAGLFSNNDELASQLTASADRTGERLWRLPIWDVYKDDIKSDVADVKNFHGKPINGAIAAAKFLEVFTEGHPAWAHLDIAGMAFADTEFGAQKNATGYGIRLLIDYLRTIPANG